MDILKGLVRTVSKTKLRSMSSSEKGIFSFAYITNEYERIKIEHNSGNDPMSATIPPPDNRLLKNCPNGRPAPFNPVAPCNVIPKSSLKQVLNNIVGKIYKTLPANNQINVLV